MFGTFGEECLVDGLDGEVGRAEGVAESLATLVEARLDHLNEEFLITFQGVYIVSRKSDDGRFHFGRRVEDMLVDGEEILDIVKSS